MGIYFDFVTHEAVFHVDRWEKMDDIKVRYR